MSSTEQAAPKFVRKLGSCAIHTAALGIAEKIAVCTNGDREAILSKVKEILEVVPYSL